MAAPQPWPPRLSLLSLLLTWAPSGAGARKVEVQAPPQVRGLLGDAVHLPCLLQPLEPGVQVTQLTWMRRDPGGAARNVAVFHPQRGPSFPEPGRWAFAAARTSTELRDGSLDLSALRATDEANYTCEFATFPWGPSRGVTRLRAIAQPQNHAERQEVTLSLEPVPVARCVSTGGRPAAHITWLSPLKGEAKETKVAGPLPGTVTVTSRFSLAASGQADGVQVTCKVEHETFEEPVLLPVTLSVRYPPEVSISGYDDNWYLGRSEATLNCDVRSNPEPTGYDWSTTSGVFPASAVARGPQLVIHSVDRLVNTTFICTVTNAVGTGRSEQLVLVRDTPRASSQDVGPLVWGAVGGTLLVLLLLAGGALAFFLLRVRRRRKSPGGGGGGGDGGDTGSYDPKAQVYGNGGPVFWTPTAAGPLRPAGEDEDEEEEEDKAEVGLMLPPSLAPEDDMESQLDGSLISRRAVYV